MRGGNLTSWAITIQAAVGGARAAHAFHLFTQFFARAQQPDVDRVHTLIRGVRDFGGGFAAEVNAAQQFGISFRQREK